MISVHALNIEVCVYGLFKVLNILVYSKHASFALYVCIYVKHLLVFSGALANTRRRARHASPLALPPAPVARGRVLEAPGKLSCLRCRACTRAFARSGHAAALAPVMRAFLSSLLLF